MSDGFINLLIVDDERSMRHMLRLVLEQQGYRITEAENGQAALQFLRKERFNAVLCDIRMPDMDGLQFLQHAEIRNFPTTIIMMSAYGSIDTALECMKLGAYDYISKPFKPDEVLLTLKKAEERLQLQLENVRLKSELSIQNPRFSIDQIVFASDSMAKIIKTVRTVAKTSSPVLISGETGTGKELIAQALHSESGRNGQFCAINCSAISIGLLESELFGHLKGSFTGADREKLGLFSLASGGTLFLDEIADLPLELQPKLLRVLQEGEIRKVGATQSEKIDTRIVAATGTDLQQAVQEKLFRNDLYYRLAVVDINLPPLRQRPEDIQALANYFIEVISGREGKVTPYLSTAAQKQLQSHSWPGNIRELQNYLEKALIFCRGEELELPPLPIDTRRYPRAEAGAFSLKKAAMRMEQEYIRKALSQTNGNRTKAAKLLEISLRSLLYKMKEFDIH